MRINSVDKTNFNANLEIFGKKVLKKNQIAELEKMVKNVGNEEDYFFIRVGELRKKKNNLDRVTLVAHQFHIPEIPVIVNVTSDFTNNRKVLLNPFEQIKEHIQKIINKVG